MNRNSRTLFGKRPAVCISRLVVVYRFAVGIIAGGADKLRADFFAILIGRKVSVGAQCSGLLCPQLKAASGKLLVPDKDVDGQVLVGGIGIQDNRCRVVVAEFEILGACSDCGVKALWGDSLPACCADCAVRR